MSASVPICITCGTDRDSAHHSIWASDYHPPELVGSEPETSPADHDSDRLATELFRRYGSVERGKFRTRDHWIADADAVRSILAVDPDDGPYWIGFYRGTMSQPMWRRVVLALAVAILVAFVAGTVVGMAAR